MADHIENLTHFMKTHQDLGKSCPKVMQAFGGLHVAAIKDGALSTKHKELISVAISVVVKCHVCIDVHVKGALTAGATKEEISEAIGVAILMGGGPATVYGALAIEAMNQFTEK
ncbi:MAG TPA: carboxymuconolactone decarboxylase family protein [Acholeplasmataceae bacterium]|nr:carboxymuconolactone decarboxylase family protein [Candidatus Cloacimonadota bacterium]HHX79403.1 carboxymuconolactone decarboxylase family protein [Acholeplasmataceae bacterium]